jgi:hypothetical protein
MNRCTASTFCAKVFGWRFWERMQADSQYCKPSDMLRQLIGAGHFQLLIWVTYKVILNFFIDSFFGIFPIIKSRATLAVAFPGHLYIS